MFAWTRLSVRSVWGLELAEARFGVLVKATRLKHVCMEQAVRLERLTSQAEARFGGGAGCPFRASGGLDLAEARFGGFVTGFRLKDFELRKVSVGSLWRLGLAEGRFGWFWRAV